MREGMLYTPRRMRCAYPAYDCLKPLSPRERDWGEGQPPFQHARRPDKAPRRRIRHTPSPREPLSPRERGWGEGPTQ